MTRNYSGIIDMEGDGIQGYTSASPGCAVMGRNDTVNGDGVAGVASNGTGVFGQSTLGSGVVASSMSGHGVYAGSDSGIGVGGYSNSEAGVRGISTSSYGVTGTSTNGAGVSGASTGGNGVIATSANNHAVYGYGAASNRGAVFGITYSTSGVGVWGSAGKTGDTGLAGRFTGKVLIEGDYIATGSKTAAVPHPDGSTRLLYCVESPEAWFEDFGEARLINGRADVQLDPDFAAVVDTAAYHVFLTPYGDSKGLFALNRAATGFVVQEQDKGASAILFSWRVVARRKDIRPARLAKVALPKREQFAPEPEPSKAPKPPTINRRPDK